MELVRPPYLFAIRAGVYVIITLLFMWLLDRLVPHVPARWLAVIPDMPEAVVHLHDADDKILYLGDSVLFRVGTNDTTPALYTLVQQKIELPVVTVTHGANAMDTFLAQIQYLEQSGGQPNIVVIPINLRSFSPIWEFNPSWNFTRQNRMYSSPLITRLLAVFKYDFQDRRQTLLYNRLMNNRRKNNLPNATDGSMKSRRIIVSKSMRYEFLVQYAIDIRLSSRFSALETLLELLTDTSLSALIYITPIDVESLKVFVNEEERAYVEKNLGMLRNLIGQYKVPWLDLSDAFSTADFDYPVGRPNEHLGISGREKLAGLIADTLRRIIQGKHTGLEKEISSPSEME